MCSLKRKLSPTKPTQVWYVCSAFAPRKTVCVGNDKGRPSAAYYGSPAPHGVQGWIQGARPLIPAHKVRSLQFCTTGSGSLPFLK